VCCASIKEAEEKGEPKPRITNYLGECFLKIATHLSYKPNFVNYMFKDDMICDGIENCVQYINNFNPEKSTNPFAYFTQIIHYAFLRRIQKEKKQVYIKQQVISDITQETLDSIDGDTTGMVNTNVEWMQDNMNHVEYQPRKTKREKTKKEKGLDKFTE
jgi:DNA-directed RNA polymerase specialized sigma24 family protein